MTKLEALNPPGLQKPKLGAIYRTFEGVADATAFNGVQAVKDRWPAFCRDELVALHAEARNIPHFASDTDDTFRTRVMLESDWFAGLGTRYQLRNFLNAVAGTGMWRFYEDGLSVFTLDDSLCDVDYLDEGARITVYVSGLTDAMKAEIFEYLDSALDPDIDIVISSWTFLPPASRVGLSKIRSLGGAEWLSQLFGDLGSVSFRLFPDEALELDYTETDTSYLDGNIELVMAVVENATLIPDVLARLAVTLEDTLERSAIHGSD